jgi:glycyl-tRNA synthetase beta chain
VFALGGEDDLVRLLARVKALQAFVATDDGTNLLAGYKRAANILKKEEFETTAAADKISLTYTPESEEADLLAALETAEQAAAEAVAEERFEVAMAALATLRAPIDAFFEKVTVNDADPDKRAARLTMLARVRSACNNVADFSKIEG